MLKATDANEFPESVPIHETRNVGAMLQETLDAEAQTLALLELAEAQIEDIRSEFRNSSKRHEALMQTCAIQGRKLAEITKVIEEFQGAPISVETDFPDFSDSASKLCIIRSILSRKGSNRD